VRAQREERWWWWWWWWWSCQGSINATVPYTGQVTTTTISEPRSGATPNPNGEICINGRKRCAICLAYLMSSERNLTNNYCNRLKGKGGDNDGVLLSWCLVSVNTAGGSPYRESSRLYLLKVSPPLRISGAYSYLSLRGAEEG
jgi:hypothetical protein